MGSIKGFNVGVVVSLGDMELALDYMNNPEIFKPDIDSILKEKHLDASDDEELALPSCLLMSDNAVENIEEDEDELVIDIDQDDEYFEEVDNDNSNEEIDISTDDTEDEESGDGEDDEYTIDIDELDNDTDEIDTGYFEEYEDKQEEENTINKSIKTVDIRQNNAVKNDIGTRVKKHDREAKSQRELELERKLDMALHKLNSVENKVLGLAKNNKQQIEVKQKQAKNIINTKKNDNKQKSNYDVYNKMDIEALYKYIKDYMSKLGVKRNVIDRAILEKEFGKDNIWKMINKNYLIRVGNGLTIGR